MCSSMMLNCFVVGEAVDWIGAAVSLGRRGKDLFVETVEKGK